MSSLPSTMKALKAQPPAKSAVQTVPLPKLRPDYILVRVRAVALNPTDWKHITFVDAPTTIGCDFAGDVVEVGKDVTRPWKKGDRICGVVHGGNVVETEDGAFGEYLVAKGDAQIKIPDTLSYEEAATLGVGIVTIGQGLYNSMNLPWPEDVKKGDEKRWILVYGGSTATGALAIQWAKLSGCEVITTCSPRNFDYVKSLGASHAFDYKSPTVGADIRKLTNDSLYLAYDTIDENGSAEICGQALSSHASPSGKKPLFVGILRDTNPREDVESINTLGYTAIGEEFVILGHTFPAQPDHYEKAKEMVKRAEKYLQEGLFKPHRHEARQGGIEGIQEGLRDLQEGKVSGAKLVYTIA